MSEKKSSATEPKSKIFFWKVFFTALLLLSLAFALGRLSVIYDRKEPVRIEYDFSTVGLEGEEVDFTQEISSEEGSVVASQNGARYHLPWCPGANQMSEENKIWFASKQEAEEAGYTPAQNCRGL